MSTGLLNGTMGFYLASSILYGIHWAFKKDFIQKIAFSILSLGFAIETLSIIERWREAQRPPFSNIYESLVFFSWAVVFVYLIFKAIFKIDFLDFFVSISALLILNYSSFFDKSVEPLIPALRSNWLIFHVVVSFLGYAAFTLSFITSLLYFFKAKSKNPKRDPILLSLDEISYQSVVFGFPFLSLGILSGAIWAEQAWGSYWAWDPKETWSLITWFIYAAYLHLRFIMGWREARAAFISIIGFLSVIFTYLGVTYFLPGLHSYA